LQAFSSAIRRTFVQYFTRFQLTARSRGLLRQLGFLSSSVKLHYYGRRIIVTPFVNQQFSLQVVERGREVRFVEQFSSDEDVTPAGRQSAHDDQTPCTQHARRRSSSPGHPRASATVSLLSTSDPGSWAGAGTSRRWPCSTPSVRQLSQAFCLHQCSCMEEGLSQENCLCLALWVRCGFCQITLTSCSASLSSQ